VLLSHKFTNYRVQTTYIDKVYEVEGRKRNKLATTSYMKQQ
jgi:hypothetical protein